MDLEAHRRYRPWGHQRRRVPPTLHLVGAIAATVIAVAILVGLLLADDQRFGSRVTFVLVATALAIWNARRFRQTRRSPVVGVHRGIIMVWAGAGLAFGLASWVLFWWQGPTDAVLMWKGLAFVVVATAGGATHGWFREVDRLEQSAGVRKAKP